MRTAWSTTRVTRTVPTTVSIASSRRRRPRRPIQIMIAPRHVPLAGVRQWESHLFVRPCPGRRRPSTIRMIPATARTSPMESHILLPVMKLPGIRFMPCPANTPPMIRAITPTRIRAMRPVRLVTSPNLPSTGSGRRSDNGPIRLPRRSGQSGSSVVVHRVRRRPDDSDPCLSSTPRSPR